MLTFEFAVAAVSLALIAILAMKYGAELREDLLQSRKRERLVAAGVFLCAISVLPAASNLWIASLPLLVGGVSVALLGAAVHWRYLSQA
jgi:hypothetical protein